MLKVMRKNTKLIIWIVVVAFCLWGGYAVSTQFQKEGRVAGEIFGKDVTFQEYNLFYRSNQIFSFAGKRPTDDANLLKIQTWQSLIYAREAQNQKIQISDDEVRAEVMRLLKDQKIENPSSDFYERWLLSSFGFKPDEFEGQLRELLRIQKLVKQFNEVKIPDPSPEQIKEQFDRENSSLNLEMVTIAKPEEAKEFYEKVKAKPSEWKNEIKARKYQVQTTNQVALDAVINIWQIPQTIASNLLKQEKGFITEPFSYLSSQALAKLIDKKIADEKKFDEAAKKQITERLTNQQKYERFMKWNQDLETRANLKDYTPQPLAPPSNAAPSEASSASSTTEVVPSTPETKKS